MVKKWPLGGFSSKKIIFFLKKWNILKKNQKFSIFLKKKKFRLFFEKNHETYIKKVILCQKRDKLVTKTVIFGQKYTFFRKKHTFFEKYEIFKKNQFATKCHQVSQPDRYVKLVLWVHSLTRCSAFPRKCVVFVLRTVIWADLKQGHWHLRGKMFRKFIGGSEIIGNWSQITSNIVVCSPIFQKSIIFTDLGRFCLQNHPKINK